MSKTTALRTVLAERLKVICPRVYYGRVSGEITRPYLVFSLEKLSEQDCMETIQLEVNAVDYGTDTTACEDLADQIEHAFSRWTHLDKQMEFTSYPDRRQPVAEEDPYIIRRRLLIGLQFYERRD